jgi:hypothetical protein
MKSFTATSAAGVLAYAATVAAFWRMPCRSSTGIARIDPIVNPGTVADHAHMIFGGGSQSCPILPSVRFEPHPLTA